MLINHNLHSIQTPWIFGKRGNWMQKNIWYMCLKIVIVYLKSNLTRGPVCNLATLSDILYLTWWPHMRYTCWLSSPFAQWDSCQPPWEQPSPQQQLSLASVLQSGMTLLPGLPVLRPWDKEINKTNDNFYFSSKFYIHICWSKSRVRFPFLAIWHPPPPWIIFKNVNIFLNALLNSQENKKISRLKSKWRCKIVLKELLKLGFSWRIY